MSKAKFDAAKELINQQQYAEARALLATINHPTARQWEAKLDALAPQSKTSFKRYVFKALSLVAFALSLFILITLIGNWHIDQSQIPIDAIAFFAALLVAYIFNRLGK